MARPNHQHAGEFYNGCYQENRCCTVKTVAVLVQNCNEDD